MRKEIDINNEEEILKECDFDYFYESEDCSRELCMFYNDIQHQNNTFDCKQAHIDLGRIAITLNKQSQRIEDLEAKLAQHEKHNAWVLEFLEKYQINTELTPEYSENPIIEYCEQVEDFRAVDNKIIEDLQNELAEKDKEIEELKEKK